MTSKSKQKENLKIKIRNLKKMSNVINDFLHSFFLVCAYRIQEFISIYYYFLLKKNFPAFL